MSAESGPTLLNNRYQLGELLGCGGMGRVYQALDTRTGEEVALKRVGGGDERMDAPTPLAAVDQAALVQEFHLLTALSHPHVIAVLDFDFDPAGRPFYTMPYLAGAQTITAYSRTQQLRRTLESLGQMLAALAYLHDQGVLHRDLKPGNALVTGGQLHLLDFGLAGPDAAIAPGGQSLQGTAAYLAPELLQGDAPSEASDMYACGVVAYECLAGHHPFDLGNMNRLLLDVLYEEPDFSSLALDDPLCNWLKQLLARDPLARPSAAAAWQELSSITSSFPKT